MRYLGGKSRLAKPITEAILADLGDAPRVRYIEPMVGGGSVLVAMAPHFEKPMAGDFHPDLVLMWQAVTEGWEPPTEVSEPEWRRLKAETHPSPVRGFVGFGCSFAGRFFESIARAEGTNFAAQTARVVTKQAKVFQAHEVKFKNQSYADWKVKPGDVVYLDPPYAGTKGYNGTGDFDHAAFWAKAEEWVELGAHVYVSEFTAPDGWTPIWEVHRKVAIRNYEADHETRVDRLYKFTGRTPEPVEPPAAKPKKVKAPKLPKLTKAEKLLAKLSCDTTWNALQFAAAGVKVFPVLLHSPKMTKTGPKFEKQPLVKWATMATTDRDKVLDMFQLREGTPGLVVGLAVGQSGLVGVDVDLTEHLDGFDSLRDAGAELPPTFCYKTPRGGWHYIYVARSKAPGQTQTDIFPAVDIRAQGGTAGGFLAYTGGRLEHPPVITTLAPKWASKTLPPKKEKADGALTLEQWKAAVPAGRMTVTVREAVEAVPLDAEVKREEIIVLTNRIARLAHNPEHTGLAEAHDLARARWVQNYPEAKHGKNWDDAMLNSIQTFGLEDTTPKLPLFTYRARWETREVATKEPSPATDVEVFEPRPHSIPDDFFDVKNSYRAALLGQHVNWELDISRGPDSRIWAYRDGVWQPDKEIITDRLFEILGDRFRESFEGTVTKAALRTPGAHALDGTPHSAWINTRNGMLDWKTGELHPHRRDYLSTTQVAAAYTPGARHPNFDRWLSEVAPPTLHVALWELIAYACYNGNPFQKAGLLIGPGGTGKGTYSEVIENIVGHRNISSLSPRDLTARFDASDLFGKSLNIVAELETKWVGDTGQFKKIVAGDNTKAEFKGKDLFKFKPWAFHIFAANDIATSADTTSGYFRRWHIIPMDRPIQYSRPFHISELLEEIDAIFTTAVQMLPALMAQGRFTETPETTNAEFEFRERSDSVAIWLDEDDGDPRITQRSQDRHDFWTPAADLYAAYANWCKDNTYRAKPSNQFKASMNSMGWKWHKSNTMNVLGIRLAPKYASLHIDGTPDPTEKDD